MPYSNYTSNYNVKIPDKPAKDNYSKSDFNIKNNSTENFNEKISKENNITENKEKPIHLSCPESKDLEKIITFIKLMNKGYKREICNTCFNHLEFLHNLKIKISLAIQEIKDILLKPVKKSELVEYFSDKINKVNLIKLSLENLREIIKLQREFECEDYETINEYYEGSFKAANNLVEAIQNSIRKHNLNISFLVIS